MMKRVLIDLTDLQQWSGHYGGTQRVVYGIAKQFFLQTGNLDYEVVFVVFTNRQQRFYETDFSVLYDRVEAEEQTNLGEPATPTVSMQQKLKRNLLPYVPESVRRNEEVRRVAVKSLQIAKAGTKSVKELANHFSPGPSPQYGEAVSLRAEDVVLVLGKPWDNLDIQRLLSREKQRIGFRLIELVYDQVITLQPQLHHPDLFVPYTQHMFEAVAASDGLLAISESTAKDTREFCKRLQLACPPITTIRLGDEVDAATKPVKPAQPIDRQYILCVGTVEIRKNHQLLYYAYKLAAERGIKLPQLIIVGSRGWLSGDFQYLAEHDPAVRAKIRILDNVSDGGLAWLYDHALFTVYPSMYEGWGLPVAESLSRGKFCLAAADSSIPEIAAGLIDYFSPYDPADCLKKLQAYQDVGTLAAAQQKVVAAYRPTSWQRTFEQVRQALDSIDD